MRGLRYGLWWVCLMTMVMAARAERVVTYPNIDGLGDQAIGFQVLKLALGKSAPDIKVTVGDTLPVNQLRAQDLLESGRIGAVDFGFDPALDGRFDPLYLPLDRGVLGWRIFIIHKDRGPDFAAIKDIAGLRRKTAGQGFGWGDIAILEKAGITVKTGPQIAAVMAMVNDQVVDFFPLGANETHGLLEKFGGASRHLQVEERLVLVYPFGRFFYFRKGDDELRAAVARGMETALADGSLQSLLKSHPMFKDAFSRANLKGRTVIRIDHPGLTPGFRKIDRKWWLNLAK